MKDKSWYEKQSFLARFLIALFLIIGIMSFLFLVIQVIMHTRLGGTYLAWGVLIGVIVLGAIGLALERK
jgi:uncharacterized membrane protein